MFVHREGSRKGRDIGSYAWSPAALSIPSSWRTDSSCAAFQASSCQPISSNLASAARRRPFRMHAACW